MKSVFEELAAQFAVWMITASMSGGYRAGYSIVSGIRKRKDQRKKNKPQNKRVRPEKSARSFRHRRTARR